MAFSPRTSRHPALKTFHKRLAAAGKKPKVITLRVPLSRTGKKGVRIRRQSGLALWWMRNRRQGYARAESLRVRRRACAPSELRTRLDQSEDYRAWKALDEALRQIEPRTLPQVVDFALSQMRAAQGSREDEDALKPFEEQMKYRVAPHGVSDPPKP